MVYDEEISTLEDLQIGTYCKNVNLSYPMIKLFNVEVISKDLNARTANIKVNSGPETAYTETLTLLYINNCKCKFLTS